MRRLREAGFEAYWAGGCVRDLLLGREPKDYDVATSARVEEVLDLFPDAVPVGAAFGVVRVRCGGQEVEVAQFRTEGPYLDGRHPSEVRPATARLDAARRDFTINGLFYDPVEGTVYDWVGGVADLEARLIRTIGDPQARFREDYLRMLRAVRLAVELNFRIEPETARAIQELAPRIVKVSPERIREELVRILTSPSRGEGLKLLDELELLRPILPEVAAMKGVPQPRGHHPEGDVFTHTVLVLEALRDPSPVLSFGALLHDVGKTSTFTVEEGRIRFPKHDVVGARIAEEVTRRLRFSAKEIERIVALVRDHMRMSDLPRMRESKRKRFFAREDFAELLELYRADCIASSGDLAMYEWITQEVARLSKEEINPPRLVSGHDLIAMGYKPGPAFREILERVRDAQLSGEVRTREEARELARRIAQGLLGPPTPAQEFSACGSNRQQDAG